MAYSYTNTFETVEATVTPGAAYPKRARIALNGYFNEESKNWDFSWTATAVGGQGGTKWTSYYAGWVEFYIDPSDPEVYESFTDTINATENALLLSGSFSMPVDSNGNLSLYVEALFRIYYNAAGGDSSLAQTAIAMPKVDMGSIISVDEDTYTITSADLNDSAPTYIPFKITSKENLWHDVSVGPTINDTITVLTKQRVDSTTATFDQALRRKAVLSKLPSANGVLFLFLTTYKQVGTEYVSIGTRSVSLNFTVDTTTIKPSWSTNPSIANSIPFPNTGPIVAGCTTRRPIFAASSATCDITEVTYTVVKKVSGGEDEVIFTNTGTPAAGTRSVSQNNVKFGFVMPASDTDYSIVSSITVKDSRGAQLVYTETLKTVYGYKPPQVTPRIYRVDTNTSTTESRSGQFVYINATAYQPYTVDGHNSIQSILIESGGQHYNLGSHISLSKNDSKSFTIVTLDDVGVSGVPYPSVQVEVPRAIWPLTLHDDLNGNIGSEFNGWVKQENDANIETLYTFKSGSNEMFVGILASGEMGIWRTGGGDLIMYDPADGKVFIPGHSWRKLNTSDISLNNSVSVDYYDSYLVVAKCINGSYHQTLTIPMIAIDTSKTYFMVNDRVDAVGFSALNDTTNNKITFTVEYASSADGKIVGIYGKD